MKTFSSTANSTRGKTSLREAGAAARARQLWGSPRRAQLCAGAVARHRRALAGEGRSPGKGGQSPRGQAARGTQRRGLAERPPHGHPADRGARGAWPGSHSHCWSRGRLRHKGRLLQGKASDNSSDAHPPPAKAAQRDRDARHGRHARASLRSQGPDAERLPELSSKHCPGISGDPCRARAGGYTRDAKLQGGKGSQKAQ